MSSESRCGASRERPELFAGEGVAHGNADRVCAAVNSTARPSSRDGPVQRRQARQAQHLCIHGQRQPPCLPSTLSLRPQLSPSRRASTMRLARRSGKAVSPSATAQSDTTAAGLPDTLSLSRSSRRRWSLRSWRRRYTKYATINFRTSSLLTQRSVCFRAPDPLETIASKHRHILSRFLLQHQHIRCPGHVPEWIIGRHAKEAKMLDPP